MSPAPRLASLVMGVLLAGALPASAEIVIGVAGPMSGPFQIFGAQMMAGAEQAVADINASGGVLDETLTIEVADDRCERELAQSVANQMVGRGIALMVGHLCSGASIVGSAVYDNAGIIQISPGARAPQYTDERPGPGIFRLAGRDDSQGQIAGDFLAERFDEQRVAIVHDNSPYGSALAEATRVAMNAAGKQEIFYDDYEPNQPDYEALITRLEVENVEVLFIGGTPADAATIARQLDERGMSTRLVSGDALMTEEFIEAAGPAGNGTFVLYPPDPTQSPAAQELITRLRARDIPADAYVLPAYAAVQIWAAAASSVGSVKSADIARAIGNQTFDTVLGPVSFDAKGDASLPDYVIYEWQDGEYAPMRDE